jgi:hypothetical protein
VVFFFFFPLSPHGSMDLHVMHEILSDVAVEDVNGWLLIAVGCFSAQSGTAADLTLRCG